METPSPSPGFHSMSTSVRIAFIAPLLLLAAACAADAREIPPAEGFFAALRAECGRAFEGRITSPPVAADAAFAGKRLVMHVRGCTQSEIRVPLHVGYDRSRTWVISRTGGTLMLKHDHRHEDGSEDVLTQYGGIAASGGTAARQDFPADDFSKALFAREKIPASIANVWTLQIDPGRTFHYQLARPGRLFRVEFDLTRPVVAPPPPWGSR